MRLLIAVRPDRAAATVAAMAATGRLRQAGHEVIEISLDASDIAERARGVGLAFVFGGDGTMLRAARALAPHGVALLGVNFGRLGFLTACTVGELDRVSDEIAEGRYRIDERALLDARVVRGGVEVLRTLALNDVVAARGELVRSIHIAVTVDGEPLIVYWADGLIIATATGSTAYGFSVGGPIILPASQAIMMAPIAPHLSFANAMVFDPEQRITLEVQDEPARLSVDGQLEVPLRVGDQIEVYRSATVARLIRPASSKPFLSLLREKILKEPGA